MAEPAARLTADRRTDALLALLLALTVVRLAVAATAPLASDEAYYWVFSRALAPGYLDHPPMVALWIRAGTGIAGQTALGVRLLGPLAGAVGSWLLYDAAICLWGDPRGDLGGARWAGVLAACFLNATLMFGVGMVVMTPDTPLLLFWTATLWALARLLRSGRAVWLALAGLMAGLAMASKYTAALLPAGVALWLLWVPGLRLWWRSPALWIGAVLGGAVFLPVVLWNAQHHWASFLRQGGRVEDWHPARAAQFLAELAGSQIGLATPILAVFFVAGAVWVTRQAWQHRSAAASLLAAAILPGAAVFLEHALGDRVQGNWPAILYPAAALAAAGLAAGGTTERGWQRWEVAAIALGMAITLLAYVEAATFAVPVPPRVDPIALQLAGWDRLAAAVDAQRKRQGAGCVASDEYGVAAELAWALPHDTVVAVGRRWPLFRLPTPDLGGVACVLVRRAGRAAPIGWQQVLLLGPAERDSAGVVVQQFALWLVAGPLPALPIRQLPAPLPAP